MQHFVKHLSPNQWYNRTMSKPVILTGVRANNDIHIGNYFGAILPIVDMAKRRSADFDINLFIPDLHSFTTPIDQQRPDLYGGGVAAR